MIGKTSHPDIVDVHVALAAAEWATRFSHRMTLVSLTSTGPWSWCASEHVSLVAKRERLISGWVQVLVQENA